MIYKKRVTANYSEYIRLLDIGDMSYEERRLFPDMTAVDKVLVSKFSNIMQVSINHTVIDKDIYDTYNRIYTDSNELEYNNFKNIVSKIINMGRMCLGVS